MLIAQVYVTRKKQQLSKKWTEWIKDKVASDKWNYMNRNGMVLVSASLGTIHVVTEKEGGRTDMI